MKFKQIALTYTTGGECGHPLAVFPLGINAKVPLIGKRRGGNGCLDATLNASTISKWWCDCPTANIGIATGESNGIIVIDVDIKPQEGKFGDESLAALMEELGPLPDTWEVITPSGGRHLYFEYPTGHDIRNSESVLGQWIDVRGNGGYVVAPPSIINGKRYEWEASSAPNETPLASLPEAWLDRLAKRKPSAPRSGAAASPSLPETFQAGTRNRSLFNLGASLRGKGIPATEIFAQLQRANATRCNPPLDAEEVQTVYNHVMRYPDGEAEAEVLLTRYKGITPEDDVPKLLTTLKPEASPRYRQTDIGNGNLFADVFKNVARYCPERKAWFIYDGKVWRQDVEGKRAMQLCKLLADRLTEYATTIEGESIRANYLKFIARWQMRSNRETILKDASSVYTITIAEFDANPMLFNCANGTLNLANRDFTPHRAEDLLTKQSSVLYAPEAGCPRWEHFISEIMSGDKDKALFLQKALGYSMTGDTREECFFVLYGATSRNGKGTCMESYKRLMGDYGKACSPETITQKQNLSGNGPSEDIARLQGARFVNISEPDKRMVLSSALVKTLTGNDTIKARYLHENSFEFIPQFKIYINTNHLPEVTDATVFSSDRIKVIPFERHFDDGERDTGLKSLFAKPESQSAILNWCLDGLRLYQETGLDMPESVRRATDQYHHDSDKILRFIEEELTPNLSAEVTTAEAFARYQMWCERNNFRATSIRGFNADMKAHAELAKKRPQAGGEKTTIILGYSLRRDSFGDDVAGL